MYSLDDLLGPGAAFVSPALLPATVLADARTVARALPATLTRRFGFESALDTDDGDAGVAVQVDAAAPGWRLLAGVHAPDDPLAPLMAHPGWRTLRSLCRHALSAGAPLHDAVGSLWLEFDLPRPRVAPDPLVPGVFFTPAATLPAGTHDGEDLCMRFAARVFAQVAGTALPESLDSALRACLGALPPTAVLSQVGLMLGRPEAALRLVLAFPEVDTIAGYLARLDWPGAPDQVADLLAPLRAIVDRIVLQLDVGSRVSPRIGLETYFREFSQPRNDPRWAALLGHCVASALCTRDKRDALLAFPGQSYHLLALPVVLARGLSHLKLVYQADRPPRAKAYYGFGYRFAAPSVTR